MKIKDFFKGTISEILDNYGSVEFDTNEFQYAELIYNLVKRFRYINCDENEKLYIINEFNKESIEKIMIDDLNPLVLARLCTYLYQTFKDDKYNNAIRAVEKYIIAFSIIDKYEIKCSCVNKIINISKTFKQTKYEDTIKKFLKELLKIERKEYNVYELRIIQSCYKYDVVDYAECFEYCINKMQDSHSKSGYIFDGYFEFMIEVTKDAWENNKISQEEYNLKQKELYILKAKQNEQFADSLNLPIQKSHYYEIAIQSLKKAGVNPYSEDFVNLREKRELNQLKIKENLHEFKKEVDFSKYLQWVNEKLDELEKKDHIKLLLYSGFHLRKEKQINKVKTKMEESILASLIPTARINEVGKTISKLRTINNAKDEVEKDEIILEHAYNSIKLTVQLNAQMIHRMIIIIKERNSNIKDYSSEIVDKSFIVPKSRKEIVKKGINYGFDFDFESSLGILIPQIENCIRELAGICGESKYKLGDDFIESANGLEYLLKKGNILEQSIDEDTYFGICAIFSSEYGLNYRNEFSHGLIENFNNYVGLYVWWYCLYLIALYS